ncbi:hypothetical protein ACLOAU_14460 [Niabella sp. CJ426]|uniref:hypothetical protein n=1 Tax=Niabella sp. CJ426 TaxID=3393740 RepID=UPI003D004096
MKTLYEKGQGQKKGKVTDRIKTFEDACKELGIDKIQMELIGLDSGDSESVESYIKLIIIAKALNEGWMPDWSDSNQYKYFPWFEHKSGFGLSYDGCDYWHASTSVGSRLCFKSSELAEYAGKQFGDIYNNYLSIK